MLTPDQCERIDVVLVSPRNPLNIGAAARAMANFGFRRLSIVAPFAVNWMEAKSAVGAPKLLRDARVFDTLAEAIGYCTLVLGTGSLDRRRPEQRILGLPEAAAEIRGSLGRDARGGEDSATRKGAERIALLFGSEKHGLTSEDLSWCHGLIVIDTCDAQPSMNLGQAVAVCLYEISRNPDSGSRQIPGHDGSGSTGRSWRLGGGGGGFALEGVGAAGSTQPTTEQLDRLARLIEETMEAANYATRGMRSANGEALRVLLRRLMPDEADLRRMMGLFRRILWQFGRRDPKV